MVLEKLNNSHLMQDLQVGVTHFNSFYFCLNLSFSFVECVYLLLAHGAPVKVKNNLGWSPLAEAISYGDRQISKLC